MVTDDNGQFSTSAEWASHKHNTNAGKTSEDGVWFGTSEPDDSKGALPYDTYIIEELRSESNKGFELIPPFEIVVSRNNLVIDLGTLTDEYEKEISIHTKKCIFESTFHDLGFLFSNPFLKQAGERSAVDNLPRSEERRVGKECRSRWSPYH